MSEYHREVLNIIPEIFPDPAASRIRRSCYDAWKRTELNEIYTQRYRWQQGPHLSYLFDYEWSMPYNFRLLNDNFTFGNEIHAEDWEAVGELPKNYCFSGS